MNQINSKILSGNKQLLLSETYSGRKISQVIEKGQSIEPEMQYSLT